jgi:Tfp pilus assembly protein PilF/predicted Ser/Thr protein kinase
MKSVMLAEPTTIVLLGGFILFLVFLLALIGAAVFLIVHLSRRKKTPVPPHSPPPTVHMANGRRYFKMGLLLLLLAGMTAVICLLLPTRSQGSVEVLGQSEFFHAFESNRIASASITYAASGSSLARITGTYKQRDPFNNQTEARYVVEKILLTEKMRDALLREAGSVEVIEPNPNTYWNLIWTIAPFLMVVLMGLALGAIAFFAIRRAFKNGRASPVPPMIPQTERMFRKCPQCGAELKPDVSEGLCPACLLQRGIATEGGAPPGTPPFTPPTIPDLAKLFPQLEILELIGKGGMGAVYKARQPALDRFVALKILAPRTGGDLDFASRFTREARALAKLSHPNIVAVYDFGQAGSLSYFIMEHVDGPNLRQIEQTGKLPPREALEIIPQICAALQFAHDEGIVHRDIKPENILLDKKGRVKIADFGLAKILGSEPKDFRLTGARDVVGTPHYMAPEQVEKPQTVDHRADIYSLGVVFYEMLTGELPLGKFQPPSAKVQIDVRLDEVVLHALEKEPDRRYQQASQVKTAVETIVTTTGSGRSRREEAPSSQSEIEPRISRTAIAGICWAAFSPFIWFLFHPIDVGNITVGLKLTAVFILSLSFTAPFGTTILGWIAMFQIRRSAGRLWGLRLAVFDGLLFLLLALNNLIIGGFLLVMKILSQVSLFHAKPGEIIPPVWANYWWLGLAALLVSVLIDFLIIRRVWHAVKKPVATNATLPILKPDRFWRWFAVVVLALISIPVVIAIIGLLAAIAIPNFVKARQQSQQNAAQQWTREGWQLWQAQKMDEAAAKFRQAVQLTPDKADAWNGLGWATFNAGKSQEAEPAFQKAISLDTNQPGALNGLGQIYLSRRQYDLAEKYLHRAAPQAPAAWHGLARLYLLEGKFDQAENWAQKVVDSGQTDDLARQMLQAAQEKHLTEGLRSRIEAPAAAKQSGQAPTLKAGINDDAAFTSLLNDYQQAVLAWTDRQFRNFFDARSFDAWSDAERATLERKLIDSLKGPQSQEFYQAINTLADLRSTQALPALREIAFDRAEKDNRDRWMATRALGIIGDKASVPEMIHLLYHYNSNTRWWAQISLVRLTGTNFAKDWNAWGKWWNDQNGQPPFKPEIIRWWSQQPEPDKLAGSLNESDSAWLDSIRPQTGEQYLQQQLKLAQAGNYWAKFSLWEAFAQGKHEVAKNPAEAGKWLSELVKGAYLAKFEPVNGFNPKTPKEMLDQFSEDCQLYSGRDSLGGASFFRTTKQGNKLIGSFLTATPAEFKAALEKNPNLKLISMEKVTPEMFLEHEASQQESL